VTGVDVLRVQDLRTEVATRTGAVRAVDGVSLRVGPGESLGVVGESGCGKTMTALSVLGLLPPGGRVTAGAAHLGDLDLGGLDDEGRRAIRGDRIAMVFQDPSTSLNPCHTVGDQVAETVLLHREVSRAQARERAREVLEQVGLPRAAERVDSYPHQLSGGMRQRVVIAMALACEPELLIADEPTTALDVTIQRQILDLLDELRSRHGMAVLLVTHDLGVVSAHTDRVAVMYAGKVVETAPTRELFERPRHPYTEALFRALPDNTARGEPLYAIPGMPPDLSDPPEGCRFAARCARATAECSLSEPELTGDGHRFACFHPLDGMASAARVQEEPAGSAAGRPLVEVRDLVKEYPLGGGLLKRRSGAVSAVAGVSFSVPRGGTFGLVGESGCGKTTVGRMLVADERPTSGSITFDGTELTTRTERQLRGLRAQFQLMFQDSHAALDPRMRVRSTLREPLTIQGRGSSAERDRAVEELVDEVGLPRTALEAYPHEFSGGQRQRIGLARALALRPRLIVADEPVSALDVSVQAQILNLMRRLQADHELTYVFISHDLSVVRYLATTIGVMYLGKLVEVGPSGSVASDPVHPYTRGLVDTAPKPGKPEGEAAVRGELPSAVDPPSGCRFRTRCPLASEVCAEQEPPMAAFSADGHQAACHHPLREPLPLVDVTAPE
jgi:peptide/nickel transport system ATP-binding protein